MSRSSDLFAEALRYLPGGVNSPVRAFRAVGGEPFFAQRAYGARIEDVDGRSYIDYVCSWGPAILGHAPPAVIDAVREAAGSGTSFGVPNPAEVELARRIVQAMPSIEKLRMTNSGTEATMTAVRLARGFTRRDKIIKFQGCYHGHVDSLLVRAGSGALTLGQPDSAGIPSALAALTITLPFNDADAVRAAFALHRDEIAALIVEPLPANAGLIPPLPGFLDLLRQLCSENGTLLIFDEVMTGFRLGSGGAQALFGVRPDLTCLGKVIGGGLPVGAVGGPAAIMDYLAPLGPVYQAGTLSGNPLAMAAGLAQLRALEKEHAYERLEKLGALLETETRAALKSAGLDYTFYRYGSMFCLFFTPGPVRNLEDARRADLPRFARFFHAMLDGGVYLAPSQFEAGFISAAHTEQDVADTGRALRQALKA